MVVLEAGCCLIKSLDSSAVEEVFKQESGEKLSIGIFASIQTAKEERNVKLRVQALNFLLEAAQFKRNFNYTDRKYRKLADLFMLYLPGLIAPLQDIIMREETQHHLITVKALICWGHIICLVLCDLKQSKHLSEADIVKHWVDSCGNFSCSEETTDLSRVLAGKERTKDWLSAVGITLKPLIMKITQIRKHSNAKCRLELTRSMIKLLENCSVSLGSSLSPITEVIVSSTCDESEEVSQIAKVALERFQTNDPDGLKLFIAVIENNFYLLLNKLPGIVHSGDEKLILPFMKSFSGYIKILGRTGKFKQLMSLSSILKKVLFTIEMSFEIDLYPEISNQHFTLHECESHSSGWLKQWKQFKHFSQESVKLELERISRYLGEYSDPDIIVDYLLDSYYLEPALGKEILLTLNQVVLGLKGISTNLINNLVDFYLNEDNLYLPMQVNNENCDCLKTANSNIIKVSLMMEGIGFLAKILESTFQEHLLRSLYYVVELMGSSYSIVSNEATKAAITISNACGFKGSIESLIRHNIDYLTYHSVIKLKRNNVGVFDVMTVLIKNSAIETVSGLEQIINNVLATSSQNLNSRLTISYLRLFQTYVLCVRKWLCHLNIKSREASNENLIQELVDGLKTRDKQFEVETEHIEANDDESNMSYSENRESLPKHIVITVAIASHCLNFLTNKDKNKKLIVLEVLNNSILILSEWENQLLPLVHKIWSPLVTLFYQMSDPLMMKCSFDLLCTLARTSRHFVRSRTLKGVLPTFLSFLLREANTSKLKESSSGYIYTQNYKLQRELLQYLGQLTADLELFEKQTDLVVESALPYLSAKQPKQLQEKCRELFVHLKVHDPYLIWFKLHSLTSDPEFSANAKLILDC
ncbi:hypothetical protein RUM43_003784 [Polyplax serrata]|uniref:Uncharacterized protein n=1 Tax=Polyplax serrata TaxID=468196 RepID=A0AAN8RXI7_POLSC